MKNQILIKHPKNWGLREEQVSSLALRVLEKKKLNGVELSLVFVGKKKAKDLNLKYRKKDYVPQVLGFPLSREADGDGVIRLGDVVICTRKLKDEVVIQADKIDTILESWLDHGVENLLKG